MALASRCGGVCGSERRGGDFGFGGARVKSRITMCLMPCLIAGPNTQTASKQFKVSCYISRIVAYSVSDPKQVGILQLAYSTAETNSVIELLWVWHLTRTTIGSIVFHRSCWGRIPRWFQERTKASRLHSHRMMLSSLRGTHTAPAIAPATGLRGSRSSVANR